MLAAAAVLLTAACDSKEQKGASGGASAAAPGPVKYTTGTPAYAGPYDGTKSIALKAVSKTVIYVPRDCPSFSCADIKGGAALDQDKLKAACPKGQFLGINVEATATTGTKSPVASVVHSDLASGTSNGLVIDGKNEIEFINAGGPIVARVNLSGMESLDGVVSAAVCPSP